MPRNLAAKRFELIDAADPVDVMDAACPCDGCPLRLRCAAETLACLSFVSYAHGPRLRAGAASSASRAQRFTD